MLKMKSIFWLGSIAFLTSLIVLACQVNNELVSLPPLVNPPFPEFDPEMNTYTFEAEKGQLLELSSGTEINVPPNALLDKNGKRVKGNVQLKFRELQDAVAIYLSGIPMTYQKGNFETAGSFQIEVEQNDEPIFLDSMQQVSVKLASFQTGHDYNFYFLDETKRGWDSLGTAAPEVNLERVKICKENRKNETKSFLSIEPAVFCF